MKKRAERVSVALTAAGMALIAATFPTPGLADDPPQPKDSAKEGASSDTIGAVEEVVVTGTLLRGVAPTGSNVIGMDSEQITATGTSDTDQLLSKMPQIGNFFNDFKTPGGAIAGANGRNQIVRPNLRNLPGGNTTTGPQTLILVDGHRVVGAGIGILAVDAEIVPPALIQRVEMITDGGSAVYGSDAIGGVINFITLRKFDGLKIDAGAGFADGYNTQNLSITAGKTWGSESAFIGYTLSHHDALFGGQRDWIKRIDWSTGIPTGRNCNIANVTDTAGTTYKATDLSTPGFSACDDTRYTSVVPETYRHNVIAGFDHDITDSVRLDVRAVYSYRHDHSDIGPLMSGFNGSSGSQLTITASNPYYQQIPSDPVGQSQRIAFNYAPVLGNESNADLTTIDSWNITPTLYWDIGRGWQLRAMLNYGESHSSYANSAINAALENSAINGTTLDTAIDPYDISATQNLALVHEIGTSFVNRGNGRDRLLNPRLVIDGSPVSIWGGDVRLAVGAEYMSSKYSMATTNTATMTLAPWATHTQSVTSAFSEVAIPIVGESNAVAGIHKLDISSSLRYDKYNDFGDTTNAKLGLSYQPVDWVDFRGNWGQSFNAPTPPDALNATNPSLLAVPFPFAPAGYVPPAPPPTNISLIVTSGSVPDLKPQTAQTWSIGTNVRPPVLHGLSADLSYYHIALNDLINSPIQAAGNGNFFTAFPSLYKLYPNITQQDIANFFALNPSTGPALANAVAGSRVISIGDLRTRNVGSATLSGLDFTLAYTHPTAFGSIDASFSGNDQLTQKLQASSALPPIDALAQGTSVFKAAFSVGTTIRDFRAQATLNHTAGYDILPSATLYNQTHIGSFDTVDLFFRYQLNGQGLTRDTALSLGVSNLLDQAPPVYQNSDSFDFGYLNGFSVGRLVQVSVSKTF